MRIRLLIMLCVCSCAVGTGGDDDPAKNPPAAPPSNAPDGGGGGAPSTLPDDEGGLPPDDSSTDPFDTQLPSGGPWANDKPYYNSAHELCDYANSGRQTSSGHDRYEGFPWKGMYHTNRTWPIPFTIDSNLNPIAQSEANRLAMSGGPKGGATGDSSWRRPIWIDGINTSAYQLTSQDAPGVWDPMSSFAGNVGFITSNGSARQGFFYQDPGGAGPKLTKIGCGAQISKDGMSKWFVVILRP